MVVHIVMFKFRDREDSETIKRAKKMLLNLQETVPSLRKMEVGLDFNGGDRAYDLSLYSTFDDREGLNEYAVHPEHLRVKDFLVANTTDSKVVDYIL
jgi:hypothetical protein